MKYAFPSMPVPRVLTPEKISLPMRILLAHRDKKSALERFTARRLLSHWRFWFRLSEIPPKWMRQSSSVHFSFGRIDRSFAFDARYAVFRPFYLHPIYEPELFFLLQNLAPKIQVFLDIGASIGMHSHCLAASERFGGTIHCFEPEPGTAGMLEDLAGQLGTAGRIEIHRFGLSRENRHAFFSSPASTNDTSVVRVVDHARGNGFSGEVRRLDDLEIGAPSAMKIDVEGHELQVIEGGIETIRRSRPFIIFESIYESGDTDAIASRLRALDYQVFFLELTDNDPASSQLDLGTDWASVRLVLNPFTTELRLARRRTLNLFACPAERLEQFVAEGDLIEVSP